MRVIEILIIPLMDLKYKISVLTFASIFFLDILAEDDKDKLEEEKREVSEKVCCKIQYKAGGFDYFIKNLEECKADKRYISHTKRDSSLCLEWKDDFEF